MYKATAPIRSDHAVATAPTGAAAYGCILDSVGGAQIDSICRSDDSQSFAVALYRAPAYELHIPALRVSRLSINLTAARVTGGVESERSRMFDASRHSMFFTPAGASMHWRKSSPNRHLNIYFPALSDADDGGLAEHLTDAGPMFNLSLPGSGTLVEQLTAEMSAPGPFTSEVVDCLARMLLVMLVRRQGRASSAQALSAQLLHRLEAYVEANLQRRIVVADLAAVAGLAPQVFARAYVRYTGRTPYQFVLAQRVAHAVELLRDSRFSLAEVALACGFSNQQHLTHVLTDRLGMAPATVRRVALHKTSGA